jgi:hypothetical protein
LQTKELGHVEHWLRIASRYLIFLCIALLLVYTFRLYRFAYLYLDDFNNLFWVQKETGWAMLHYNIDPTSNYFRPFAMLFYWILLHVFDLNPLPYHVFAWIIHCLNVFLVYLILKFACKSAYGAAFGSMIFAFQAAFAQVFWNFGTIFEVLGGFLFFLGIWIYFRFGNSIGGLLLACAVYFAANNTKEMDISLPIIWLLYEVLVNQAVSLKAANSGSVLKQAWNLGKRFILPAAIGLFFVYLKVSTMAGHDRSHPYYMDFSWVTLGRGYGWYLNALYQTKLRWGPWMFIVVFALAGFIYLRSRWALFFLAYILITLLPVVFLINHRADFYWYIPFLGISGLIALAVGQITRWVSGEMSARMALILGIVVFAFATNQHYLKQRQLGAVQRNWGREVGLEYQSFISGLRALDRPGPDETIYYASVPQNFDAITILSATQVAFRRTDVNVQIVKSYPPEAKYRVRFENPRVIRE